MGIHSLFWALLLLSPEVLAFAWLVAPKALRAEAEASVEAALTSNDWALGHLGPLVPSGPSHCTSLSWHLVIQEEGAISFFFGTQLYHMNYDMIGIVDNNSATSELRGTFLSLKTFFLGDHGCSSVVEYLLSNV